MKILITGATGYIGRRLTAKLLTEQTVTLRLMVRHMQMADAFQHERTEIVEADALQPESLKAACDGIDTAYYLIHSMGEKGDFRKLDRVCAENFLYACIEGGVKRIIYLGGLGVKETASEHLLSRIETGEILSSRPDYIQTVWIRAGIIIGAGSASFEILYNFVKKFPILPAPRSVKTLSQPVAVEDVLKYLAAAKDISAEENIIADIGSAPLAYREIIQKTVSALGVRRIIFPLPFSTPRVSAYLLSIFFPVNYRLAASLLKGISSEAVAQNKNAQKYFPAITPLSFPQAAEQALSEINSGRITSRWSDTTAGTFCSIKYPDDFLKEAYHNRQTISLNGLQPQNVFSAVSSIGGTSGWFRFNLLWEIRGLFDKMLGGYGINRGRRDQNELRVGDSIDCWKVVELQPDKRILLMAQMIMPGKGWLEFRIENDSLIQTAYYLPRGIIGHMYWIALLVPHHFIFKDMSQTIIHEAQKITAASSP